MCGCQPELGKHFASPGEPVLGFEAPSSIADLCVGSGWVAMKTLDFEERTHGFEADVEKKPAGCGSSVDAQQELFLMEHQQQR